MEFDFTLRLDEHTKVSGKWNDMEKLINICIHKNTYIYIHTYTYIYLRYIYIYIHVHTHVVLQHAHLGETVVDLKSVVVTRESAHQVKQ